MTLLTPPNVLRAVADQLEESPHLHDQGQWCGTACCIAGWITAIENSAVPGTDDLTIDMVEDNPYEGYGLPDCSRYSRDHPFHVWAEPLGDQSVPDALREVATRLEAGELEPWSGVWGVPLTWRTTTCAGPVGRTRGT